MGVHAPRKRHQVVFKVGVCPLASWPTDRSGGVRPLSAHSCKLTKAHARRDDHGVAIRSIGNVVLRCRRTILIQNTGEG